MKPVIDSFWRAAAYCLHPRVIGLSLVPLLLMVVIAGLVGWFAWQPAVAWMQAVLGAWSVTEAFGQWLAGIGLGGALAPLAVVMLATPLVVLGALLAVALMMTPAIVSLVASRRFPALVRLRGGSFVAGAFAATGGTVVALFALVLSMPLWFIPPLVLIVPPLIWGWLTYRVMSYDVLAEHASRAERQTLMREHRGPLLSIGVACGLLGGAPSVVWASGLLFVALAPLLVPLAIWIYTLVFAFSALWFAHYLLAALEQLRAEEARTPIVVAPPAAPVDLLPSSR